jgi:hypothetical protein
MMKGRERAIDRSLALGIPALSPLHGVIDTKVALLCLTIRGGFVDIQVTELSTLEQCLSTLLRSDPFGQTNGTTTSKHK